MMIVGGVSAELSVWGCERSCHFSGSTAYLSDLARVAKLVLNEWTLVCYFSCNTNVWFPIITISISEAFWVWPPFLVGGLVAQVCWTASVGK